MTALDVDELAWRWIRERTRLVLQLGKRGRRKLSPSRVHDLRVACRRLRATLAFFDVEGLGPAWRDLDRAARRVAKLVAPLRELDVACEWLAEERDHRPSEAHEDQKAAPQREAAKRLRRRWTKTRKARAEKVETQLGRRLRRLRQSWQDLPRLAGGARGRDWLVERLAKIADDVRAAAERAVASSSPPEKLGALHRARVAVKHQRYAVELTRFLLPADERRLVAIRLRRLQERGGELQDLADVVARLEHAQSVGHLRGAGKKRLRASFVARRDQAEEAFLAQLAEPPSHRTRR